MMVSSFSASAVKPQMLELSLSTAIPSTLCSQRKQASSRWSRVSVEASAVSTSHALHLHSLAIIRKSVKTLMVVNFAFYDRLTWDIPSSSARSLGLMARASQPPRASTCPVFLKLAPITIFQTLLMPGSSSGRDPPKSSRSWPA